MQLNKRYKRLANGGGLNEQAIAEIGTGLIDTFDEGNEYGRQSTGSQVAKGALSMASTGFMVGGPIGAGVGALVGGISGLIAGNDAEKKENEYKVRKNQMQWSNSVKKSDAMLGNNPSLSEGNRQANYFKVGGNMLENTDNALTKRFLEQSTDGGTKELATDSLEMVGNSHNNGGIEIPNMQSEVEGGETTKGSYVFSKELGFADLHKPIARSKGKIETKPYTAERIKSIELLDKKEEKLKSTQEYIKQHLNLR